jgi:hypothetical protein
VNHDDALDAAIDEAQASYEAWRAERRDRGRAVIQAAQRSWAAMDGWDRLQTPADWEALRAQTVEDWESGASLITMLGGERYLEPERAALCLMLWQDFLTTYQPAGPAEYLVVAMAVVGFDHFLRVNSLVHNLAARLEYAFFSLERLQTTSAAGERGGPPTLVAEQQARALTTELVPLLDRLNRLVLRNLQALRALRPDGLALTVQNYGQVNVAALQTNQAPPVTARTRRRTARR